METIPAADWLRSRVRKATHLLPKLLATHSLIATMSALVFAGLLATDLPAASSNIPATGRTPANRLVYASGGYAFSSAFGEPVNLQASPGANQPYRYYIEVPTGVSQLTVDLFDADIGAGTGGNSATRITTERNAGLDMSLDTFATTARYRLFNPSNTQVGATLTGNGAGPANAHDAWLNFQTVANPAAGHWLLEVDQTFAARAANDDGNDPNAFGIRAYVTSAGAGDTELNVYYNSYTNYVAHGPNTTTVRTFTDYPWVTSGCSFSVDNFDGDDSAGTTNDIRFISFGAGYTSTVSDASGGTVWDRDSYTDFARFPASPGLFEALSRNYGIGELRVRVQNLNSFTGGGSNYIPVVATRFNGANYAPNLALPTTNPRSDTFRVYLPTDGNVAPVKPRMTQRVVGVDATPLNVGVPKQHLVEIYFYNPTPFPVTFSSTNTLTATIPGPNVVYGGAVANDAIVSQGTVTTPAPGASGTVTANPGVVAAGGTYLLQYLIRVTPPDALLLNVTGTETSGGTQARYVDETGNTTQTQATYTFGPLCPVAVRVGVSLEATMGEILATANDDGSVTVVWETLSETNCAGFQVSSMGERLTPTMIPAEGTAAGGALYTFTDRRPWHDNETQRAYFVEEVDLSGQTTSYGPASTTRRMPASAVAGWNQY